MPPYDEPYWRVEDYEALASNSVIHTEEAGFKYIWVCWDSDSN